MQRPTDDFFAQFFDDEEQATPSNNKTKDNMTKEKSLTQWINAAPNTYQAVGETIPILEAGLWEIDQGRDGPIFIRQSVVTDELILCPGSAEDKILKEVEMFWSKRDVFEKVGYLHRRGLILYGPPGTGKTSLIQMVVTNMTKLNGVTFYCKDYPAVFLAGLKAFRAVEPERPVVCLFEDIEELIANYGHRGLLSMLDGENNVNHVLNIATTNFLNNLDERIVGRPRRFDKIFKIDMPTAEARKNYFTKKHKITNNIDELVDKTKGLSFAALADLVIAVSCLEQPLDSAINKLKKLQKAVEVKAKEGDTLTSSKFSISSDDD